MYYDSAAATECFITATSTREGTAAANDDIIIIIIINDGRVCGYGV